MSLASVGVQAYGVFDRANLGQLAGTIIEIAKENKIHPNDISIISSQETRLFILPTTPS
ncbi:hypothetical protein [Caballeronia sp. CLC5]|uniref:hypothetical protein n=1 Tax=Caballeronia sp. CLC5 TaxID=2906764 RepID=UPI001F236DA1|nr:hypothetical protein [Caballeronia sp. CLC5]MCE4575068.1 hypothetical protein [Caballeronia sp. CLC5]